MTKPAIVHLKLGSIDLYSLSDGTIRLDGGALFGVVPRVIWEKIHAPDDRNRVLLEVNPLLICAGGDRILVDTGMGDKWGEKFIDLYGITRETTLLGSLAKLGLKPEDIDVVVNTHLHFDHAGGNTVLDDGGLKPAFPRARYLIQRRDLDDAFSPTERTRASYLKENFEAIDDLKLFDALDGSTEISPGVRVEALGGHTAGFQTVRIKSGGQSALFLGDLFPTVAHLKPQYTAAYDLFPVEMVILKKRIVEEAIREGEVLVFEHDPEVRFGRVKKDEAGRVVLTGMGDCV
jgi:glyoxylase-like metal-dependent hydrolase (beta-lactamase superfamily II)